ncbi:MAG: hypothetical protein EBZ48_00765 [Proteobacteria bacterium]|nr:hypothetical protein [Pseudomonadota bacterium]
MASSTALRASAVEVGSAPTESSTSAQAVAPSAASAKTTELTKEAAREERYASASPAALTDRLAEQPPTPTTPGTSAGRDHHEVAHTHFLTLIAVAITKKEQFDNNPEVAEYIRSHPEIMQQANAIATRLPTETAKFRELLSHTKSPEALRQFIERLPLQDVAPLLQLAGESFLQDLPPQERARAAEVITNGSSVTKEFVELIAYKRFAEELAREKAVLLSQEVASDSAAIAEVDKRLNELLEISRSRFGNDAAITTHILATAQRSQDFAMAQQVTEQAMQLARRAGAYEGLQAGQPLARRLDEYLAQHHDLLERHPDFAKVLRARVEEERQKGREIHRDLDFRATALHDEFHRFWGTRDAKIKELLKDLDGEQMLFLRQLYSEKFPDLHLREEITQHCSDTKTLLELYGKQDQGFARRGLNAEQYGRLFRRDNTVIVTDAICSRDPAARLAVEMHDAMAVSPQPVLEIARKIQESPDRAQEAAYEKSRELFGRSIPEALAAKAQLQTAEQRQKNIPPTHREQRDELGLAIVTQSLNGQPVGVESIAQFALSDANVNAERLGELKASSSSRHDEIAVVEAKQVATNQMLSGLYGAHPELRDVISTQTQLVEEQSRERQIHRTVGQLAYEVGLARSDESEAVLSQRRAALDAYLASQKEFQANDPARAQRIAQQVERCDSRGVADFNATKKAVDQLYGAVWGPGTDEDKSYQAVSGKSPELQALFRREYLRRHGETVDQAIIGDFSGAERDKSSALLINDRVAANTASIEIELGAFFGPSQEQLRELLRDAKTDAERARLQTLFAQRYAPNHYQRDPEGNPTGESAKTLDEALKFRMVSKENREILAALGEGKHDRGDALILRQQFHSSTLGNPEPAELAATIDRMRDQNSGLLDVSRIDRVMQEFRDVSGGKKFHEEAGKLSGSDAEWLQTMVPDGRDALTMEVQSRAAKLSHGIQDGLFSGNSELINQALSAPQEIRARADAEEREYGKISGETATQLQFWQELNKRVSAQYMQQQQRSVEADLDDRLSAHDARISNTLRENARLSVAQQLWDSMEGVGTSGNPADLIKGASKKGMAAIRADFAAFSGSKESLERWFDGDLSGHEWFDATLSAKGRPETIEEILAAAKARLDHEQSGWSDELGFGKEMTKDYERLVKAAHDREATAQLNALYGEFVTEADGYRMSRDMVVDLVANTASTTIIVVGSGVAIVCSGGTATFVLIGVGAGVARAGTKLAFKGDGYSQGEMVADGAQTVIDAAVPGVLGAASKAMPGLNAAGRAILAQGGERMLIKGAVDVTGKEITKDVLVNLGQRHLVARTLANTVDGTIIGVALTPVQAGLMTAVDERTYANGVGGVGKAFWNNTVNALPHALTTGLVFTAALGGLPPGAVRAQTPLSPKATSKVLARENLTPQAREYLTAKIAENGVITRGDVDVANLANSKIGAGRSKRLVAELQRGGTVDEAVIKGLESKIATEGSLSKLDAAALRGKPLPHSSPLVTAKEIDLHTTVVESQIKALNKDALVAQKNGDSAAVQRANETLEVAQSRRDALASLKERSENLKVEAPRILAELRAAQAAQKISLTEPKSIPSEVAETTSAAKRADEVVPGNRSEQMSRQPVAHQESQVELAAGVKEARNALAVARESGDPARIQRAEQVLHESEAALAKATQAQVTQVSSDSAPSDDGNKSKIALEKSSGSRVDKPGSPDKGPVERVMQHDEFVPGEVAEIAQIPEATAPKPTTKDPLKLAFQRKEAALREYEAAKTTDDMARLDRAMQALDQASAEYSALLTPATQTKTTGEVLAELQVAKARAQSEYEAAIRSGDDHRIDSAYQNVEAANAALSKAKNQIRLAELEASVTRLEQEVQQGSSVRAEQELAEARQTLQELKAEMRALEQLPGDSAPATMEQNPHDSEDGTGPYTDDTNDGLGGGPRDSDSGGGGGVATLEQTKTKTVTEEEVDALLATLDATEAKAPAVEPKPDTELKPQTKPVETEAAPQVQPAKEQGDTVTPPSRAPHTEPNRAPDPPATPRPAPEPAPAPKARPQLKTAPRIEESVAVAPRTEPQPRLAPKPQYGMQPRPVTARLPQTQPRSMTEEEQTRPRRRLLGDGIAGSTQSEEDRRKRLEPEYAEQLKALEEIRKKQREFWARHYLKIEAHGELTDLEKEEAGVLGSVRRMQGW